MGIEPGTSASEARNPDHYITSPDKIKGNVEIIGE
jgi:hypothetical protein